MTEPAAIGEYDWRPGGPGGDGSLAGFWHHYVGELNRRWPDPPVEPVTEHEQWPALLVPGLRYGKASLRAQAGKDMGAGLHGVLLAMDRWQERQDADRRRLHALWIHDPPNPDTFVARVLVGQRNTRWEDPLAHLRPALPAPAWAITAMPVRWLHRVDPAKDRKGPWQMLLRDLQAALGTWAFAPPRHETQQKLCICGVQMTWGGTPLRIPRPKDWRR